MSGAGTAPHEGADGPRPVGKAGLAVGDVLALGLSIAHFFNQLAIVFQENAFGGTIDDVAAGLVNPDALRCDHQNPANVHGPTPSPADKRWIRAIAGSPCGFSYPLLYLIAPALVQEGAACWPTLFSRGAASKASAWWAPWWRPRPGATDGAIWPAPPPAPSSLPCWRRATRAGNWPAF